MNKVKIYTPFDCLIVDKNSQHFLSKNEHLEIEFQEKIFVYPIGRSQCYSFVLETGKTSPYYKEIEYEREKLVFILDGKFSNTYSINNISIGGKVCQIKIGKDKIVFSLDQTEREILFPFSGNDFKINKAQHIVYVTGTENEQDFLVAFNTKNKKAKVFEGDEISLTTNGFILKKNRDKIEYLFDNDGLSILSCELSSQTNYSSIKFFSYLNEGDYQSAYSLLSPVLKSNLTQSNFKNYIGKITYYFPLSPSKIFALSNNTPKLYTITFENSLILDIDDKN